VDLPLLLAVLYFSVLGTGLGYLTGLAPGIHVNTLALVLVSLSPVLLPLLAEAAAALGTVREVAPLLMVTVIVAAAVAHSILDFLPSIFLGAPEEGTALSTLPGHRLLLEGRGLDAVLCSAYGGLVGAAAAVALCLPLSLLLGPPLGLFPLLDQVTPFLVVAALIVLVLSEKGKDLRVVLRVRRVAPTGEVMSLVRAVPVNGLAATLTGRVERDRYGRRWLRTAHGRWRLKGARGAVGPIRAEGVWRVRRTAVRERCCAGALLAVSGLLGLTCMGSRLPLSDIWEGMDQSLLFPLLTGLFGIPGILGSLHASTIPPQLEPSEAPSELASGLRGALSGALVGWFPGISSTTGVIIASAFSRNGDDRSGSHRFLTMTAAVGTSSTVLGLLALSIAYEGRSGAMLAAKAVLGPEGASLLSLPSPWFPLLLAAVLLAAVISYLLALRTGRFLARRAAGANLAGLNRAILVLIIALVTVFCGLPGLVVLIMATGLGSLPPRLGVSRVHLTGCLLVPTALYFLGLKAAFLAML
jgi:TctA family transporter